MSKQNPFALAIWKEDNKERYSWIQPNSLKSTTIDSLILLRPLTYLEFMSCFPCFKLDTNWKWWGEYTWRNVNTFKEALYDHTYN